MGAAINSRSFPPPSKQTLPPGVRARGLSMNAGSGTRPQVNEPFYQIALPPRLGHEFRLRCDLRCGRRGGWLLAERPGTLAKQFRAICGVILDLPHFAIGLGGLVLTGHLMSKQKHPALAQGRGISLLGSCMLGAERV